MKKIWLVLISIAFLFPASVFCADVPTAVVFDASSDQTDQTDSTGELQNLAPIVDPESAINPPPNPFTDDLTGTVHEQEESLEKQSCQETCDCGQCARSLSPRVSRVFGSLEYQHWYTRGRTLPPLVTTDARTTPINSGAPAFTPIALTIDNALNSTSQILFGAEKIGTDLLAGGRLTVGSWLDDCSHNAIAIKLYASEGGRLSRTFSSAGNPPLGRPFFNTEATVNAEDALPVAHDNFGLDLDGTIGVQAENDILGTEVFYRHLLGSGCRGRMDLVTGYQFNRIDDDLLMSMTINDNNLGNTFESFDLFDVSNQYHGGTLGLAAEWYHGCWTLHAFGKLGFGNMHQRVAIAGETATNGGTPTAGGFFAQPTNIGVYSRNVFAWSPEASVRLSYAWSECLTVSVGYTLLYWTNVALAGDQIDRNIAAVSGVVTGPDPTFQFHDTDFWAQTIDIGVSLAL